MHRVRTTSTRTSSAQLPVVWRLLRPIGAQERKLTKARRGGAKQKTVTQRCGDNGNINDDGDDDDNGYYDGDDDDGEDDDDELDDTQEGCALHLNLPAGKDIAVLADADHDQAFWLCRLLDDVTPEDDAGKMIRIRWYELDDDENYEIGAEDTLHVGSILVSVRVSLMMLVFIGVNSQLSS